MSFEQEWAQHKAAAAERQTTHMQLNQLPADGGSTGGKQKLKVNPSVLRNKARKAEEVAGSFIKADNKAMSETGKIKSSLKGFESAGAFDDFEDRWRAQMKYLQGLLHKDVAGALRTAATEFEASDKFDMKPGGEGREEGSKKKVVH